MLKLSACACGPDGLVRIERSWWMRCWRSRRLYFCTRCRTRQLIAPPPIKPWPVLPAAADARRHPAG